MRSVFLIGLIGLWVLCAGTTAQELAGPPPPQSAHDDRLESRLVELAQRIGAMRALGVQGDSETVSVIVARGHERVAEALGAQIEARSSQLVRVRLPVEKLVALAQALPEDAYVRLPLRPWGSAVRGLDVTGMNEWHAQGIGGQGVRVAVIDIGFTGLSEAIASGKIANVVFQKDYTRLGMEGGDEPHGTEVTEILYAMAPQAEFMLYRIADEVDLENAVEDALQRGVRVMNHSVGWVNTDFGDGTGIIAQIAQSAVRRGIVWVNAAGNAAQRHWSGPWQDPDGDGWLNLDTDTNRERFTLADVEAVDTIEVFLTWDEWPRSRTDYDLYLLYDLDGDGQLDPNTETVAASTNRQSGRQPPTESIEYIAPFPGQYFVAITGPAGTGGHTLRIFSFHHDVTPAVAGGQPVGSGPGSRRDRRRSDRLHGIRSGAIEPFSSQGPTSDGRIKPDLAAPDGMQTSRGRFFGTSASAPAVAGAAALLLSREPTLSPAQLRARLLAHTRDVGPAGPDSIFGVGKLLLRLDDSIPEIPLRPGDLTGDGHLDRADLKLLRAYLRGRAALTPAQAAAADVAAPCGPPHDRSTITKQDYKVLQRAVRGRQTGFECYSQTEIFSPFAHQFNPTMIQFVLADGVIWRVEVFSLSGRRVFQSGWTTGRRLSWDLSTIANGVYLYVVTVQGADGQTATSKISKLVVLK